MPKQTRRIRRPSNELGHFIEETAALVTSAAATGRTMQISQSFAGSGSSSATVVCFVTCPSHLVLEMQSAIDRTVKELLADQGSMPVSVH
jgi:hypothetical protein